MVACAALCAHPAPGHPGLDGAVLHLDVNTVVDFHAFRFQGLGLGQGAGHPVQDEAVCAVALGDPVSDDAQDQLVRDQRALVHVLLCFFTKLRTIGDCLPEHVPGRDGGNAELLCQQLCLCSLSGAGRAQ